MRNLNRQNGNVLFFILIAVVLFAALTYAVTKDGSGGAGDIATDEQARIAAGSITRDMKDIAEGFSYLRTKGCSIDDIEATYPAIANLECQIFHPDGAGIAYPKNLERFQTEFAGAQTGLFNFIRPVHWQTGPYAGSYKHIGVGTGDQDIILRLNYVTDVICAAFNTIQGYGFTSIPEETTSAIGSSNSDLVGKHAVCSRKTDGSPVHNQISFVIEAF